MKLSKLWEIYLHPFCFLGGKLNIPYTQICHNFICIIHSLVNAVCVRTIFILKIAESRVFIFKAFCLTLFKRICQKWSEKVK